MKEIRTERAGAWRWSSPGSPTLVSQRRPLAMASAELEAIWRDHVERAEGPGGLHAFLCTMSPGYLPLVTLLRTRQRALLDDLDRLRLLASSSSTALHWLRTEYGRLVRAVVMHDELETEILCDAIERG